MTGPLPLTGRHSRPSVPEWRLRLTLLLLSSLLCLVFLEVGARAFWSLRHDVPFRHPDRILYAFYPELRKVDQELPTHEDPFYDVLLLSGSVLHPAFGPIEQDLQEQLAREEHRKVRIFNLAVPAHTSRDSRLKYAALGKARFELVVIYHGINEARANSVPPDVFRDDYGHYAWYELINALAPYHGKASFALPYTLRYLALKVRQDLAKDRYIPTHTPREDWVHYGRVPRSARPFKENLSAILDLAAERDDRAMLMTFATYAPEGDSLDAFVQKQAARGLHAMPIGIWGSRENVLNTIAVHNGIVRDLVARHENVLFVDQARLMAGSPRYFTDVCHFTVTGAEHFVQNMLPVLFPRLQGD
jgi:hypothetical protein